MQGRRIAAQWQVAVTITAVIALAAIATLVSRTGDGSGLPQGPGASIAAHRDPQHVSQVLAAARQKAADAAAAASPTPAATPTLRDALLAADALGKAGRIAEPTPTLQQSLEAADALIKAGVLEPPPSLEQTLRAADELARAGIIPPTIEQSMIAADKLRIAGLLPSDGAPLPAAEQTPTLRDALLAADAIRIANEAQQQALAAPPQSAPEPAFTPVAVQPTLPPPPPPPAPTSTPVPPPPPPPPAPTAAPQPEQSGGTGYWDANFTAQVLALVNQRRASAGLGPVAVESRLEQSARDYAKVLADNNWFSHTGPDGSTLVTRVTATGFPFDVQIGEVLAWGTDHWQPAEIVQAWMDSPGHKEQLLGPYTRAGAGCYFTDAGSTVRCVIDFAG
jgi:uncharacterized protein YkwD